MHFYVDESARGRRLLLAAVAVDSPKDRAAVERELRALLLPRQARIHMVSERPSRRREILECLAELPLTGWIVESATGTIRQQRDTLLRAFVQMVPARAGSSITFDYMDAAERRRDRMTLANAGLPRHTSYRHAAAPHPREPMLWAADVLAWTAGNKEFRHSLPAWVTVLRP